MKKTTLLQGTRNPFRVEGFCANRALMPPANRAQTIFINIGANRDANQDANSVLAPAANPFAASTVIAL
jgi:hypothetical protein